MILSLASAVMALVYLLSFVAADDQLKGMVTTDDNKKRGTTQGDVNVSAGERTNTIEAKHNTIVVSNSTISLSMADRVQLAQTIRELLKNDPEAGQARNLRPGDLVSLFTRVGTSTELFSSTANIISAFRNGDSSSLVS